MPILTTRSKKWIIQRKSVKLCFLSKHIELSWEKFLLIDFLLLNNRFSIMAVNLVYPMLKKKCIVVLLTMEKVSSKNWEKRLNTHKNNYYTKVPSPYYFVTPSRISLNFRNENLKNAFQVVLKIHSLINIIILNACKIISLLSSKKLISSLTNSVENKRQPLLHG